jgi:predicted small integral membrane protein
MLQHGPCIHGTFMTIEAGLSSWENRVLLCFCAVLLLLVNMTVLHIKRSARHPRGPSQRLLLVVLCCLFSVLAESRW